MRAILAVLVFGALIGPTPVWAQSSDDDRAYELYQNGESLYGEGRYEAAILAWDEAYRLSKRSKILFNIASAYERMGQTQKAIDTLFTYKAFATAEKRDQVERRIRSLEARLAEEQANPVQPQPQPEPVIPTPPPAPTPDPEPVRSAKGGGPSGAGLVLLGTGVVVGGAGVGLGIVSAGAKSSAEAQCVQSGEQLFCSKDASADLQRHKTTAVLADIGFGVGAVAAGTGVVLLATHKGEATVGVGPNRIWMNGRF